MDLMRSSSRDLVIAVSPCGMLEPSPRVATEASRGGATGVVDLGSGGWQHMQALAQAAASPELPAGVRVPAGCAATPADVRAATSGRIGLAILGIDTPWDIGETTSWTRVLTEVTSREEARAAVSAGAHGLIARGLESGGRVSELSTFVLLQQLLADETPDVPVWAAGGIGPRTAVACVIGGAAGVILDSQLGLMPESDLPGDVLRVLRRLDGSETVMTGAHRGIRITGSPARLAGPRDTDVTTLPIGQDGHLAAPFAARWRDTADAVRGIRLAIEEGVRGSDGPHPLGQDGPLAADLGIRVPVAQGPMTRVSDQANFAAAVAAAGALPFIALALADGERSRRMLGDAAAALGDRPWGAGILGFVPDELRAAQLEAILEIKPQYAIIAGGRPAQARELEQAGIATFLHVPSPGLLRQFLHTGSRRFVFEGAECGGHIGPRASFTLWEGQLAVIEEFLGGTPAGTAEELQLLFAGGIHDARSSAMVAAMTGHLSARGVRVGVLMGTAYLFTREAVEHGAIKPLFQRTVLDAEGTALLETAPGHVTRALRTPFVAEFARQRAELETSGTDQQHIWAHLEMLNTGRLRLASKGLEHDGTEIDEAAQAAEGLYMAGQVAVLRNATTTVAALHAAVTSEAVDFHAARTSALRGTSGIAPDEASQDEGGPVPLDIAIVGMSCMFAGSPDVEGFWRTVLSGKDAFSEVPTERWDPEIYYVPEQAEAKSGRHAISKWGGFLEPVAIDPIRYGIPPTALGSIDPSQLLALQVADSALKDAGYSHDAPTADHSHTGVVFAAAPGSDIGAALAMRSLLPGYLGEVPPELDEHLPTFTEDTFPGNLPNVIAGRVANRFDLGGVNFTVDAACAASLAALDVACKQLAVGTADLMLCGAVDMHNSVGDFLMFSSVHALSPKGRVATFDSDADGTTLGEGVACVALKRLDDARRDGDRIYAVIKGIGGGSDGRARSLTAPRPAGQVRAMRRAYRQAGISPSEVTVVEGHGTGTVLGDQVELESLTEVFGEAGADPGHCVLGSVKSQIGHAKCAAGLAGLIKTALGIYYGVQPPTCNLTKPNSAWDAESSPFAFLTEPRPWVAPPGRRLAGVSAFGFGGTNFHVVLSGHAGSTEPRHGQGEWPAELFCFRGADREAAHRAAASLAAALDEALAGPGGMRLRDLAVRAAETAEAAPGQVRAAVVARDTTELATLLRRLLGGEHDPAAGLIQPDASASGIGARPGIAFLFPGQGSQRTGALAELFVAFPELRQYLGMGQRWLGRLFPPASFDSEHEHRNADLLRDTTTAQPVLGMCGLAVSHLLGRLGISPGMSGGHSYGELVALATAGAFDPATLLSLSHARATAMLSAAAADPGTMAAVGATAARITEVLEGHGLTGEVTLANLNTPSQVVISGPTPAMDSACTALHDAGLRVRRLPVACAFHSPVVAGASERFAGTLAASPVAVPQLPVWSNRTARPHQDDPEAIRAEMAEQISAPVRFGEQVAAMYEAGARIFVEAGPGQVLTGLVREVLGDRPHLAVACDGPRGQGLRKFLTTLAELACAGAPLNMSWLFRGRGEPGTPAANGHPLWITNGQLIRDINGAYPPGGLTPARLIKEFRVYSGNGNGARYADPETILTEYLRTSREMVAAQRDVMLSFLGGQPAGRLVWEQAAIPAVARPEVTTVAEIATIDPPPDTEPAAAQPAGATIALPSGPELQSLLIAVISERTGYPADLIDPELDLEADLSIDSIKRAEIAGQVAARLGIGDAATGVSPEAEAAFEELVKARTVQTIMGWYTEMASRIAEATSANGESAESGVGAPAPGAGQKPDGDDLIAGAPPARFLPVLTPSGDTVEIPGSLGGTRFVVTGDTEIAGQLAARLDELGARASITARDTVTAEDIREADGLIMLDGLATEDVALPPALFPLIKDWLTGDAGRRWLLAAGRAGSRGPAGLAGLFRAIGKEYPDRFARYVQVDRDAAAAGIPGLLLGELSASGPEPMVAYQDGIRHVFAHTEAVLPAARPGATEAGALGLTSDSVVVLIGGGRGVTAWFARELAAASGCRVELVGRTKIPGDPLPEDVAAAEDPVTLRAALARNGVRVPAEIERATRDILARREISATIKELTGLGATVRYHSSDVLDSAGFRQVIKLILEDHGRIDGLVYGAGVIEDQLIAAKDPESFTRVFSTKVSGAEEVLTALAGHQCTPGFVVLYGSVAAVFGNRGQADYAAANDALATLADGWAASTGQRCLVVHWGPWLPQGAHPGMVSPELGREYARRGVSMIDPRAGAASLLRELAWGENELTAVVYAATLGDAR